MAVVKAKILIKGLRGFAEEVALVDAGSTYTIIDKGLAEEIGAEPAGRKVKLVVATAMRSSAT